MIKEEFEKLTNSVTNKSLCFATEMTVSIGTMQDIVLTIQNLNRLMPHIPSTCKHNKSVVDTFADNVCDIDVNKGCCSDTDLFCWHGEWELKE